MAKKREERKILVPKSLSAAATLLDKIASRLNMIDSIETKAAQEISELKACAALEMNQHHDAITDMVAGIFCFAETHREVLTDDGKVKSVKTSAGTFGWRTNPPSIRIKKGVKIDTIIARVEAMGLTQFIRKTPELDKEQMLKEQEVATSIKDVAIRQDEVFFVRCNLKINAPKDSRIEAERIIEKLRKAYGI